MTDAVDVRAELIGLAVRRERIEREWSQAELARRAGLSASAVNRIEAGQRRPRLRSIVSLADALGLAVRDLME